MAISNSSVGKTEDTAPVMFAALPIPEQSAFEPAGPSVTLRIGDACLEFHQKMTPTLLKTLVETLRSC